MSERPGKVFALFVLFVAVLVDGFFGVVNFYPVAPARARGPKQYVLAEMDPTRAKWFQENVLDEYNEEFHANLELKLPEKEGLLDALTRMEKDPGLVVAVLPKTVAEYALEKGLVTPFEGKAGAVIKRPLLDHELEPLRPETVKAAQIDGKQAFLPRGSTIAISVYRRSRVRDAMLNWQSARPAIDAALKSINGRGLPEGYALQDNPRLWDSYDRFVLAYFWAHRSYNGFPPRPRVAHPTGDTLDGQIEVAAGIYRAGGTDATFAKTDSPASIDYFAWEALYAKEKLFLPEMMGDAPLDERSMVIALQTGDIFLANIDIAAAFTLRGGSFYGALTFIQDPDDLGFVVLPRFSSLALDPAGHPQRTAKSFAFRDELVWALPAPARDPKRALGIATWLVKKENHIRDCEALGYMPMRKDVFREVTAIFRNYWMSAAFDAAVDQWGRSQTLPAALEEKRLGSVYAQLWKKTVSPRPLEGDPLLALLRAPPEGHPLPQHLLRGAALKPPPEAKVKDGAFIYPPINDTVVLDLDAGPPDAGSANAKKKDGGR
jgi:hypothetical protein